MIVMKAVESALAVKTMLIGDDIDLLILFFYHESLDSFELFLKPERKINEDFSSMKHICSEKQLGPDICSHILFLHAILG